jgi:formiminoglutamase
MSADWPTAAEWLASGTGAARGDDLVVAGVPVSENAVTPSRYDLAPGAIRATLERLSSFNGELGIDLTGLAVCDLGDDLVPPPLDSALTILLGGHNGVTYEVLSRCHDLDEWGLLTLDAHHDVRPYEPGTPSNGSPVRALVDAGLPGTQIVQIGISGFANAASHRRWCQENGIVIRGPREIAEMPSLLDSLAERCRYVYVDLDIDVLDRSFAPGCPGSRPGGITPKELFDCAYYAGSHRCVRAVDLVEVDPDSDVAGVTVFTAAVAMLDVAAGFRARLSA